MNLRLSDLKVLHFTASSSSFFRFCSVFSLFSLVFRTSKFLDFKEFNKTIIPFALAGYVTRYSQLGSTRLVGYFTISYPTRAHGIIVNYPGISIEAAIFNFVLSQVLSEQLRMPKTLGLKARAVMIHNLTS